MQDFATEFQKKTSRSNGFVFEGGGYYSVQAHI